MTDETTEQVRIGDSEQQVETITLSDVMKAIADFKVETNAQLEAIRQNLVANGAAFDRLEAVVYSSRSDVANLRADIKELSEEVRQSVKITIAKKSEWKILNTEL